MTKITRFRDIPLFTREASYQVDYPMDHFIKYIDDEIATMNLQLCPDFQRGHVWTEKQQIAYLEFFLRGGKTGRHISSNCPSWHRPVKDGACDAYVCVDGLQRITAFRRFLNNEIKVFGSYRNEFTDSPRLLNDTIRLHVNDLKTRREVLQWYIDMNAGGTPNTKKEITRVTQLLHDEIDRENAAIEDKQ